MFLWIAENLATVLICLALVAAVVLIITNMVKKKKKGQSSCGCASCPMSESCHSKK